MSEYARRQAPATKLGRFLRLMGPYERAMLLIGVPVLVLVGLQFITQMAVVAINRSDFGFFNPILYLGLWGAADPAARYGVAGGGVLHWIILGLLIAGIITGLAFWNRAHARKRRDPQLRRGLAEMKSVVEQLGVKQLVLERGPKLAPSLQPDQIVPQRVGYRVGSYRGVDVWTRAEDPTIVIGPSRSGKGFRLLLGWIMDAPGAVITTSVKMDNAKLTMRARQRLGSPVLVWAPGIEGGRELGHTLSWDITEGCVDEGVLIRRINALIPSDAFSGSTSNGGHWDTLGRQLASALFHAAACGGLDVDAIWTWVANPKKALAAVDLIREHPAGIRERADQLEYVLGLPPEQLATSWGVLPTVLAFMDSRAAREWLKPTTEERVDLVRFLLDRGTLYIVGDKNSAPAYVRLVDALLAEIDYITKGLAAASPGSRMDPAVTYVLDELGNLAYQGFYELITAGGGYGRVGVGVFQSRNQLDEFGDGKTGKTLWDAAVAKIVLPGGGDAQSLGEIAELVGKTWVERESHTIGSGQPSKQLSAEREEIFSKDDIRTLDQKYALMFYRNLRAVVPETTPFSEHPRFAECMSDAEQVDDSFRANSIYAEELTSRR
ncbi:type IV secretory system conjugative DNA transfer family protein [Leucobacter zeae]|nr:type IV secretory system conjugative DNA transfer family protein [Leucobacter zeae]